MRTIALLRASNILMTAAWYGHLRFTAAQLKIFQECIALLTFVVFAWLYLTARLRWNEVAALALVLAAVIVVTLPTSP
jgi:hypothetical protein